jgi:hypothetical protein
MFHLVPQLLMPEPNVPIVAHAIEPQENVNALTASQEPLANETNVQTTALVTDYV